ncbi:hypothetical protein, partial [Streptomyces bobili]
MSLARIKYSGNSLSSEAQNKADRDRYLIPLIAESISALHISGVADGLTVSAADDGTEVKISTGRAVDPQGRLLLVAEGGWVETDLEAEGTNLQNLTVGADGVSLSTTGQEPGNYRLTLSWGEVEQEIKELGDPLQALVHAPWLRLVPDVRDEEVQVVLAHLTLGTGGLVKDVVAGSRRVTGLSAGILELRRPLSTQGAVGSVSDVNAAELVARPDGGLELNVLSPDGVGQRALSVDGASGKLRTPAGMETGPGPVDCTGGLRVQSAESGLGTTLQLRNAAPGTKTYSMYAGKDSSWHVADKGAGVDRLLIDQAGSVGIGAALPKRTLHVEGSEVHSGGSGGGFS